MDKLQFFLLVVLCLITHIIRSVYEILKYKKILKSNKLTFIIIFINMIILWASWFALCAGDLHKIILPDIIRFLGFTFVIAGVVLFFTALFTIRTLESYEGDLITKGIYSKIRHPMYLGFILWLVGPPVYFGALFPFIISFLFIANILFWRHLEEKELEERFIGYKEYKTKTIF